MAHTHLISRSPKFADPSAKSPLVFNLLRAAAPDATVAAATPAWPDAFSSRDPARALARYAAEAFSGARPPDLGNTAG